MNKRLSLLTAICGILIGCQPVLAIETNGYLDNKLSIYEGDEVKVSNKLKIDAQVKNESYLLMISAIDLYEKDGRKEEPVEYENSLELSRAYLELYRPWGKASIGLQNIAWGTAYLYNLADLFNEIDILDPKGEKKGINALDLKWNIATTAMVEAVAVPRSRLSEGDYGLRSRFSIGNFEIVANAVQKQDPVELSAVKVETRDIYVLECKGEFGENAPAVWGQWAYNHDALETGGRDDYQSWVLGMDYTFDLGNGLYLMAEYYDNGKADGHNQSYFVTRYNFQHYLVGSLNMMRDYETGGSLYSANLKYMLNDNIEFNGTYNYYPSGSAKVGLADYDPKDEIVLSLKTTF